MKMAEFLKQNYVIHKVISGWQLIGICLGIVGFKYDHKSMKFVLIKYHKVISFLLGCLIVLGFPVANIAFFQSIEVVDEKVKYSFSSIVSSMSDFMTHLAIFFSYYVVLMKRKKILGILNGCLEFEKKFKDKFPRSEALLQFKYKVLIITTLILNFLVTTTAWIMAAVLTNPEKFPWFYKILFILPKFCALYMGSIYFFGIFWIKYQILKILQQLKITKSYEKFYRRKRTENCFTIQGELEKISEIHQFLWEITREFQELFLLPLLFLVTGCFLGVMTQCFYGSLITIFPYYDHIPDIKMTLQVNGVVSLLFYLAEIAIHTGVCSSCNNDVRILNF